MSKFIDHLRSCKLPDLFSDLELKHALSGTEARRFALVKRALAKGELIRLKRGHYCVAERYRTKPLNLFAVAGWLRGLSYVSFESALSYHGWIPEATSTVSSACTGRSHTYQTALGVFEFRRVPARVFFAQVDRIMDGKLAFLMASPWKAIADYVYINRKDWKGITPLIKSLRIEADDLKNVTREELELIDRSFGKKRISVFLRNVLEEMKL